MRTPTATESAQLGLSQRATHLVVTASSVAVGQQPMVLSSTPLPLAVATIDWAIDAKVTENVDDPVRTAEISIARSHFNQTIAPFISAPLYNDGAYWGGSAGIKPLDIGSAIQIYTAVLGMDEALTVPKINLVFNGFIDLISWATSPIKIRCRDLASRLVDLLIEDQRVYPNPLAAASAILVEDLMQDIMDDNIHNAYGSVVAANYVWNGTTTVTTTDTSALSSSSTNYIAGPIGTTIAGRAPFFEVASFVANTSITILNPAGRTIPTGSGAGLSKLLIDDTASTSRVTLFSITGDSTTPFKAVDSPGWAIKPYEQKKQHTFEALRILATQIGYDLRYKWNPSTSAYELTFYEPERTKTTPDWTFAKDRYFDITQLDMKRANIRNVVKVTYLDSITNTPQTVVRTDAASILKHGRRAMLIAEGGTSQIDSSVEGGKFADAGLADLKDPDIDQMTSQPYFWIAEIGDLYRFTANDVHYDTDQDLAVVAMTHNLKPQGQSTTQFATRGKPAAGFMRYFEIEARGGVGAPPDEFALVAPETVVATGGLETLIITYKDPLIMDPPLIDWAYTECYVKISTIPDPPSASDLKASARTTRFEVQDLIPGTTYFARLIMYDRAGNKSVISAEVTATIGKVKPGYVEAEVVGPYQSIGDNVGLNFNSDVNVFSRGSGFPPDRWRVI